MQTAGAVFTIPHGVDFYATAASWLRSSTAEKGVNFADLTIWLPAPRQRQALLKALSQQRAMRLPTIKTFAPSAHDWAMLPNPPTLLSEAARWAFFVQKVGATFSTMPYPQVVPLAQSVQQVAQHLLAQEVPLSRLQELVPERFYTHWQAYAALLEDVLSSYFDHLKTNNLADPAAASAEWLRTQAEQVTSPHHIALGFADTTPAGRALLKAIVQAGGALVVPGATAAELQAEPYAPAHPLAAVQALVKEVSTAPPAELAPASAAHAFGQALFNGSATAIVPENLTVLQASSMQEEAEAISLALAEAHANGRRTALITPNRQLAQQVGNLLFNRGIVIDDSAGVPLAATPAGEVWARLLACMQQRWRAAATLSLLQHPLVCQGRSAAWQAELAVLDKAFFRRQRQVTGLTEVARASTKHQPEAELSALLNALTKQEDWQAKPLQQWCSQLAHYWQLLAPQAGASAAYTELEMQLAELASGFDETPLTLAQMADVISRYIQQTPIRPVAPRGQQLFIWGPLEARLQPLERAIVGGLTQEQWQASQHALLHQGQWAELGISAPSQAGGLVAHDWCGLLGLPQVMLSYSVKNSTGAPTQPARLISRLQGAVGAGGFQQLIARGEAYINAVRTQRRQGQAAPAEPAVVAAQLPTTWSASGLGKLMQCPYQAYVHYVLKLRELDPWEEPLGARERGTVIHKILEQLVAGTALKNSAAPGRWEGAWQSDTVPAISAHLIQVAEYVLAQEADAITRTLWQARLQELAPVIARQLVGLLSGGQQITAEEEGKTQLGGLTLTAKADLKVKTRSGTTVVDYKTGTLPSLKDVTTGASPQLPVLGLVAGGAEAVSELALWRFSAGGKVPYEARAFAGAAVQELLADAATGLAELGVKITSGALNLPATPGAASASGGFDGPCRTCAYSGVCRVYDWAEGEAL